MATASLPRSAAAEVVGRREELAAVGAALDAGGCVIAGAAGVGKSRLAATAVAAGDDPVIRVIATASAAAVPFGAFAHLLPPDENRPTIPRLVDVLTRDHPGRRPVVLVDDAHLLDPASAALLLALVTTGAARLLLTVRTPEPAPDAITAIWKEHAVARLELQPLGRRDVADLLATLLDGAAHPRAVERIHELSQGNPLYIHELVRDAVRTGALTHTEGVWRWQTGLLTFDRLQVLVERHVRDASPEAVRALELLAIGAPLPLAFVSELVTDEVLEELERVGLVVLLERDGAFEINVAHPIYAEVVAAGTPKTVALRLRRHLADTLERTTDPADAGAILKIGVWRLDAGELAPDLFVRASAIALRRGTPELALRMALAAGDRPDAATAAAEALNSFARFEEVESVLAPHEAAMGGTTEVASTAYLEARFRALLRGTVSDDAEALLDRAAGWYDTASWTATIATQRAWSALYASRPTAALGLITPYLADASIGPLRRMHACAVAINAQSRLGLIDDALATAATTKEVAAELVGGPWEVDYGVLMFEAWVKIGAARDLPAVEADLRDVHAEAMARGDQLLPAVAAYGLGVLELQRGHAAAAAAWLEEATDADAADPVNTGHDTLLALTFARALLGDVAGAERAMARADVVAASRPASIDRAAVQEGSARAWIDVARGRTSAAIEALVALAAAGHEHPDGELTALHDAVRLGADPGGLLPAMHQRAKAMDHELVQLFVDHTAALVARDPDAQLLVAAAFADLGLDLLAAEAAAEAALSLAGAGRATSSRAAAAVAARHAAACPGVRTPALQLRPALPALTPRELEVARLAAKGVPNKEIAELLIISVRTVESCVLRACRKLGADNRHSLALVLDP